MFGLPAAVKRLPTPGALLDLLMPRHCALCGEACSAANICPPCRAELPRTGNTCALCALPTGNPHDAVCGACLHRPPPWDGAVAGLVYRFPVDQLVCRLKFSRDLSCVEILADALAVAVRGHAASPPDVLAPVPLHRTRHFARSFNQADLIARRVGVRLGMPVDGTLLTRRRRTPAQSGLDAAQRRRNVRGAFGHRARGTSRVAGRHVALVDDVMTTGTTLAECCRVLRRAGADRVSVWVAARAPPP